MYHQRIDIRTEGSLESAVLVTYLLDSSPEMMDYERPVILICPGGAYAMTSDREAEAVALRYNAAGFHAAILRYSVAPAVYPTALLEVAKSILCLRELSREYRIHPNQIFLQGFSAGGHLAASYGVFWTEEFIAKHWNSKTERLKPNGLILSYPVITSGIYAHEESFRNLLADQYDEQVEKMSLENQVNSHVPPVFLWHTLTDDAVPVENSLLFVSALRKHNITTEFHMFANGGHGLGLASRLTQSITGFGIQEECAVWMDLAIKFVNRIISV